MRGTLLDRGRGAGQRRTFRLKQRAPHGGVYVIAEAGSLDELAVELDDRGILMWPEGSCE